MCWTTSLPLPNFAFTFRADALNQLLALRVDYMRQIAFAPGQRQSIERVLASRASLLPLSLDFDFGGVMDDNAPLWRLFSESPVDQNRRQSCQNKDEYHQRRDVHHFLCPPTSAHPTTCVCNSLVVTLISPPAKRRPVPAAAPRGKMSDHRSVHTRRFFPLHALPAHRVLESR